MIGNSKERNGLLDQIFFSVKNKWLYNDINRHIDDLAKEIEREHYDASEEEDSNKEDH